ncbi:DUF917 domain-containing protein [Streptacidiphilus rugosus]|uniref:DUF917 domain-containing protein n=1 Tax=Streptacidiphilus rugosus TaxID=405783 RepID=UPI00056A3FCE|nr:DUF917 domain-containing protein [Streptacidiphilus rugosus]
MTTLTEADLSAYAAGCALLSTGGGGAVDSEVLGAAKVLRDHGPVTLIDVDALGPDDLVLPLSAIGAPTVADEMLFSGREAQLVRDEVERQTGRRVAAVMATEIGGANGVAPVGWAAALGLPLLDADGMGRAFPELPMVSMNVAGIPTDLVVLADVQGNVATLRPTGSDWSEHWSRALCVASGSSAVMADYLMTGDQARTAVIRGTLTRALHLGRLLHGGDPLAAVMADLGAMVLAEGKITQVRRDTLEGFTRGHVTITGTGTFHGRTAIVDLLNENLAVREDGHIRASIPDLITLLDTHTATPLTTDTLRYGQRVTCLAWPCDPLWRTPKGLATAGPAAFGYTFAYHPVEEHHTHAA